MLKRIEEIRTCCQFYEMYLIVQSYAQYDYKCFGRVYTCKKNKAM